MGILSSYMTLPNSYLKSVAIPDHDFWRAGDLEFKLLRNEYVMCVTVLRGEPGNLRFSPKLLHCIKRQSKRHEKNQ